MDLTSKVLICCYNECQLCGADLLAMADFTCVICSHLVVIYRIFKKIKWKFTLNSWQLSAIYLSVQVY